VSRLGGAVQNPEQLAKAPDCRRVLEPFGNVPYTYMHQVADINLAAQWKQADMPVLVIYGTASPVTTARQSRYLADMINSFHPGRATYVEGHGFGRYESQAEFLRRHAAPHPFHTGVLDAIFAWLDTVA
jgi:pimeloyl-ACP methyl ester carboxylesterase